MLSFYFPKVVQIADYFDVFLYKISFDLDINEIKKSIYYIHVFAKLKYLNN
jgi:hypothetical protein